MTDIAQISSVHPTFDTRVFEKSCKTLVEHGWRVKLIVQSDRAQTVDGVEIVPLPKPNGRLYRVFRTGRQAMRLALESGAPICHIHDPELLLWTWMLTRRGRIVVFDMHENLPAAIRAKDWVPPWLRPMVSQLARWCERVLLRNKHVVLAEESYLSDYGYLRSKIVVQNFPRATELAALTPPKTKVPTLVYLGHIHWTRGSRVMVQTLARLRQEGIVANLLLIGRVPPDHQAELEGMADAGGVEVEFAGHMAPAAAWRRVAACHVGMAILSPEPNYITSYPTKMFEYMALGLPVVTSNFPLYRAVVEQHNCGYAVDPEDFEAVTDAVRALLKDTASAREAGAKGRAAVRAHYSWEAEQGRLIDMYSSLLS